MTNPGSLPSIAAPATDDEEEDDIDDLDEEEEDIDSIMDDDDDDTVVGTCLHCSAPPPPRSSRGGGGVGSGSLSFGGGGCGPPCPGAGDGSLATTCVAVSPSPAARVQVSCDDCRSFICDACHWCHEFQANHEIRVCDRCDAFYCRGCDEMDQCEDCSEVVCNTCSTLMSCKFCGCGLCEDCATACGRCGIVLCARDAKFAVECDTCRMSYCLVCLASGTKDPCVRCGHRPSKRVEQLVHLRLKSIYKAFKQSGASVGPGSGNGNGGSGSGGSGSGSGGVCSRGGGGDSRDSSSMGGKYSSALRSLAENGAGEPSSGSDKFPGNFDQSMASEVAAVLQTASSSMAGSDGDDTRRARGKHRMSLSGHGDHSPSPSSRGVSRHRSSSRGSNAAAERYFRKTQAEMEAAAAAAEAEAEAAAAALLAELDEEKETSKPTSKKSKKKKKKKEKKKEAAVAAEQQQQSSIKLSSTDNVPSADKKDNSKLSQKRKGGKNKASHKSSNKDTPPIENDDSSDEEMNLQQLVGRAKSGTRPSKKDRKEENGEAEKRVSPPPKPKLEPPPVEPATTAPATTADFDAELAILLSNEDEEGLETFLANLKGVPGLGAARKTAKKALKKIREASQPPPPLEQEKQPCQSSSNPNSSAPSVDTDTKAAKLAAKAAFHKQSSRNASAAAPSPATANTPNSSPSAANQHEPLLRVVSRTQSNLSGTSSRGGGGGGNSCSNSSSNNNNSTSVPASARAECVMHMSPAVVGWVIGKGGSRIRDMMEESGAKIWIDQESMGAKEARVVYVSGKRSSVDTAVRMVKDLVSKAPVAASAAAGQGVAVAPAASPTGAKSTPAAPVPASSPATQNPPHLEAIKEPTSFAAAIGALPQTAAATVTPPGPNPANPAKQQAPPQSWALPAQPAGTTVVPPPLAAPQSVQPAPQQTLGTKSTTEAAVGANPFHADLLTAELACDPRFVALLIGRRGWTVKNIQSESGADLRIDQSRDPPRVIISGRAEDVRRAERMVRDVLKYPNARLHHQEVSHQQQSHQQQPHQQQSRRLQQLNTDLGTIDLSYSGRSELNHVGDLQRHDPSQMPMTSLHRDVSSSTPTLPDELQMHQEPSRQTNFSQVYTPFQQQTFQQNQNNLGLFQDSSSVSRISEYLPNDRHQLPSANVDPNNALTQSQESWGHHGQQTPGVQNQYSTLPPFSGGQVNTREQPYMLSNNLNTPSLARQSPPRDNSRRPSATFVLPPEHHLHFSQNHEAAAGHQVTVPPAAQAPSTRIGDFMSTGGGSGHAINGWDLPTSGSSMGGTWNQQSSHHNTSLGRSNTPQQQPGFQALAAPPLSNNPFEHQPTQNHHVAPTASQPTNNSRCVSDDSLMVDNMFASMGTVGKDGDGGLLNALNSVSLGGEISQHSSNWESKIAGWTAESSSSSSSFLQHSRLGDYRD